jgi:hypothetical protein
MLYILLIKGHLVRAKCARGGQENEICYKKLLTDLVQGLARGKYLKYFRKSGHGNIFLRSAIDELPVHGPHVDGAAEPDCQRRLGPVQNELPRAQIHRNQHSQSF